MYFVSDVSLWNNDFLRREIMGYIGKDDMGEVKAVYYKNKEHLLNIGFWNHVVNKKPEVFGNCVFHFCIGKKKLFHKKRETNIEIIKEVVKILNPRCIVFCGDENLDLDELNDLGNRTTLFLREYNKPEYTLTNNSFIIPVGYSNGIGPIESIKPCTQRKFHWSFGNDVALLDAALLTDEHLTRGHIGTCEKGELKDIYNDSIFVPVVSKKGLDCTAIYDALACGAIPIIVGGDADYKLAFGNFLGTNCIPPWVHGETWEDVLNTCRVVLDDEEMLTQLQKNCIIWWQNILSIYRSVIHKLWEE